VKLPQLYPFQKVDVWRAVHRFKGRVLIANDVGTGKTVEGLHIASHFKHNTHRPIVVVCPASVKYQWEFEVRKHKGWDSWVLNGLSPPQTLPLHIPPVIILNWDILRGGWTDKLIWLQPIVVIADECHATMSPRSQRTLAFRRLCNKVPYVVGLSGTPIQNSPVDFFPMLNILRKDVFPSFRPFAFKFTNPKMSPWGVKFEGSRNEKQLHELLTNTCYLRRTKEEVLKDLPKIQRTLVPIDIKRKEYEEAENNFLGWMFKNNPGKAMRAKSAVHIAKLTYLLGLVAKLKSDFVIDWIEEFLLDNQVKLTVFGHHRSLLEKLHDNFKGRSVLVYGGIGDKKRQLAIDQFVSDPSTDLFLGSITATGTGINKLQNVCSNLAVIELIYNPKKLEQVEGRLHRLGQKLPVTAYYLLARDTIEIKLCKILLRKQKTINAIVDNEPHKQEFEILKLLFAKQLRKGKR
jgi:SWI/SNF-related matrix-associated actin-dependent regulator 1 of chromatin subfamily A